MYVALAHQLLQVVFVSVTLILLLIHVKLYFEPYIKR